MRCGRLRPRLSVSWRYLIAVWSWSLKSECSNSGCKVFNTYYYMILKIKNPEQRYTELYISESSALRTFLKIKDWFSRLLSLCADRSIRNCKSAQLGSGRHRFPRTVRSVCHWPTGVKQYHKKRPRSERCLQNTIQMDRENLCDWPGHLRRSDTFDRSISWYYWQNRINHWEAFRHFRHFDSCRTRNRPIRQYLKDLKHDIQNRYFNRLPDIYCNWIMMAVSIAGILCQSCMTYCKVHKRPENNSGSDHSFLNWNGILNYQAACIDIPANAVLAKSLIWHDYLHINRV